LPALLGVGAVVIENNTLVAGALLRGHVSKTLGDTPDNIPVGCVSEPLPERLGWPVAISGDIGFFAEIAESTATGRHRSGVTIWARNLSHFVWLIHFLAPVVFAVTTERTDQLVNGSDCLLAGIASILIERVDVDPLQSR
jgi:hypothetical protein